MLFGEQADVDDQIDAMWKIHKEAFLPVQNIIQQLGLVKSMSRALWLEQRQQSLPGLEGSSSRTSRRRANSPENTSECLPHAACSFCEAAKYVSWPKDPQKGSVPDQAGRSKKYPTVQPSPSQFAAWYQGCWPEADLSAACSRGYSGTAGRSSQEDVPASGLVQCCCIVDRFWIH